MVWEADNLETKLRKSKEQRNLLLKAALPKLISDYVAIKKASDEYKNNSLSIKRATMTASWIGATVYGIKELVKHTYDIHDLRQSGAQEKQDYHMKDNL